MSKPDGSCRHHAFFLSGLLDLEGSGWADICEGSRRRKALLPTGGDGPRIHRIPQEG